MVTDYILKVTSHHIVINYKKNRGSTEIVYLTSCAIKSTLQVLGLEVCAETLVGNQMIRGISGGQRKRVTTGKSTSYFRVRKSIVFVQLDK